MRKLLFLLLIVLIPSIVYSDTTLKGRLIRAKPGDFIVTSQGGSYALLLVRCLNENTLVLEEVSVDQSDIDLKKISWKEWIENRAPKAQTWTAMVIDLKRNALSQCFSYLQKQWLFIEKSDYYLGQLLTIPLSATRDSERKRVGPAPMPGEIDRRKLWKPQLIFEGKKKKETQYEVLRAKWPDDKTRLAGCIVELYLDAEKPNFPFPYWIEIQSPHYTLKVGIVDSGTNIHSPMPELNCS